MKRLTILLAVLLPLLTGCKGTWLMYDTTQRDRLYFTVDGGFNVVSFALRSEDEVQYKASVTILGTPKDHDRTCPVEIVSGEDATVDDGGQTIRVETARQGVDYTLGDLVIPAGSVNGTLTINLLRNSGMVGVYKKIDLRIVEDDKFLPMDPDSSSMKAIITPEFVLYVTDGEPSCPEWWKTEAGSVDYQWGAYYGRFAPAKFRKMLELYHAIEGKNAPLYEELLAKYVYNIDAPGLERNFMSKQDQSVWATYVLIPLHDYYVEYYKTHPEEAETFAEIGDLTSGTWGNPLRLLR